MKRVIALMMVAVITAACGESARPSNVSMLGPTLDGPLAAISDPIGDIANSCSDIAPVWLVHNSSTDRGSFTATWSGIFNIDVYEVRIFYSRDGSETPRLLNEWMVSRTDVTVNDSEGGGRYYIQVRAKNRCDRFGAWSDVLTVYFAGDPDQSPLIENQCPWEFED